MSQPIYQKLREQLDQYSTGFPSTESGIEFKILEKLYSPEEAELYLNLSMMLETPDSVAQRIDQDPAAIATMLENMAAKGLIFRKRKNGNAKYAAIPFVIGSYEFQLKNMDREFALLLEEYFQEGMLKNLSDNIPPLRTIPVGQSIDVKHQVASYEDARQIIQSKNVIAVAECICRKQQSLVDKGCEKPKEVCLIFGSHAQYYVDNNMGRYIDQDEAITILDKCEKAGLVNQPANMINPGGMCNCCGDCCGVLRGLRMQPKPAQMVYNRYSASVDEDNCTGCETCLDRCQMDAIIMDDDIAVVNPDRCIGCGLCVTTCPTEAISLGLKPEDQLTPPPQNGMELMNMTAQKRNKSLMPMYMKTK